MKTMKKLLSSSAGNSLVEILIALALTGIITTAVLGLYYRQHSNYMVQENVTAVQQNARATIGEITRQLRMAGYEVPAGVPALVAANTDPDTITINYSPENCETYIDANMVTGASDLSCGTAVDCFEDGQWAYIFHPDSGGGEWFQISAVDEAGRRIEHSTMDLSKAYAEDAVIVALQQVKFYISTPGDTGASMLMMEVPGLTPQIYAENISDLQFTYRLENGNIVDLPLLLDDVTEVLVEVTAQSEATDPEMSATEYRTRTYRSSASLRNVGL
ncbi:hypothetical protein GF377_05095 [candidate division GN15 bacterium]|nr:hypothetical protein [candidate division GN15 bacterium]